MAKINGDFRYDKQRDRERRAMRGLIVPLCINRLVLCQNNSLLLFAVWATASPKTYLANRSGIYGETQTFIVLFLDPPFTCTSPGNIREVTKKGADFITELLCDIRQSHYRQLSRRWVKSIIYIFLFDNICMYRQDSQCLPV